MPRFLRVPYVAGAFLFLNLLGFILSGLYNLYSCANQCTPRSGWSVVFSADGSALEPPWFFTVAFALILLLALRPSRWGLLGLLLVFIYGISYINGEQVESFPRWAFTHNLGFSLFLGLSYLFAAATALAVLAEVYLRARNRGRRPSARPSPTPHPTAKPQISDQPPGEEVVQVNDRYVGGGPPPSDKPDADPQHPTGG